MAYLWILLLSRSQVFFSEPNFYFKKVEILLLKWFCVIQNELWMTDPRSLLLLSLSINDLVKVFVLIPHDPFRACYLSALVDLQYFSTRESSKRCTGNELMDSKEVRTLGNTLPVKEKIEWTVKLSQLTFKNVSPN